MWKNRIYWILGATAGLASALIDRLIEEGAHLVLHGRHKEKLQVLKDRYGNHRAVTFVEGELTDHTLMDRLWEARTFLQGTPSGMVCFIGTPGRIPSHELTVEKWAQIFIVNTAGPVLLARSFADKLKEQNLPGNIILFSTMQALYPFEGSLTYAVSKAGIERAVTILAKEYGGRPFIRINAIAPGVHNAGMARASIAKGKYDPYVQQNIIPRFGSPEDIARTVMFFLHPDLYITGQVLLQDGGLTLRRDFLERGQT